MRLIVTSIFFLLLISLTVRCSRKNTTKNNMRKNSTHKLQRTDSETRLLRPWTWQIGISILQGNSSVFKCGGTLIEYDVVMTAAHCLQNPDVTPDEIIVTAGDNNRDIDEHTEQTRDVVIMKLHPNYTGTLSSLYSNDIALLKLTTPITATSSVSTIELPTQTETINYTAQCYIIGWGLSATRTTTSTTNTSGLLSKAEVNIMTNAKCNARKYWDGLIKPGQICAFNKRVSACLGDSGGPLVCHVNNSYVQYGITSWGSRSCDTRPSVFTRVQYYTTWINETIEEFKKSLMSSKLTNAFDV